MGIAIGADQVAAVAVAHDGGGPPRVAAWATFPATVTTLELTEAALSGFRVEVFCSATIHVEGSQTRAHVALRAHAEFGHADSRDHVVREVGASAVL